MFDPATLQDPQALQIQWTPLRRGGASFTTQMLCEHPKGLEYRKSGNMLALGVVFLIVGVLLLVMSPVFAGMGETGIVIAAFTALVGVTLITVGVLAMRPSSVLFNYLGAAVTIQRRTVPFGTIVALQLLTERIKDDENDFESHELNLVLADGSRLNLVDHGGKQELRGDLARLRELIGCKAWDGTTG